MWCIRKIDDEFNTKMFDVLKVYERPLNALFPVVCIDEKSKQLLSSIRADIPMAPKKPTKTDYEYKRAGTVNIFVAVEPKGKKRKVTVTKQRKALDFAKFIDKLVTVTYKNATKVILVTDNLNTHNEKSIIRALGEEKAKQILARLEWHYTPKHASWLDQAEIEINALSRQCLSKRIGTFSEMQRQCAAWQHGRNSAGVGINWQFTREKALKVFKLEEVQEINELLH